MKKKLNCPFCGTENVCKEQFHKNTGVEIEKVLNWNGEAKLILQIGKRILESQTQNGENILDKEKLFNMMKEERNILDQRAKEIEDQRKNIAKEQKERFTQLEKRRVELEKKEQELVKQELEKLPEGIMKQIQEIQTVSKASMSEIKETLSKMIHNVKMSGNIKEFQLTKRLRELNTGDQIELLGGANQEDVLITVENVGKNVGKIKVDSKNIAVWNNKYFGQMQRYLKDNSVDFGIIATTTMPKDAAGQDIYWKSDNVIVVSMGVTEAVYLTCRYLLLKNAEYQKEYDQKVNLLKENAEKMKAIKDVLNKSSFNNYLKVISTEVSKDDKNIDDLKTYFDRKIKAFRESNSKIIKQVNLALDNEKELQTVLRG